MILKHFRLWKIFGTLFVLIGFFAIVQRFIYGLGSTTNMGDDFPWGLWIGVDMLVGVGLAAGGFSIAAAVYIFNLERFRTILRPTILTAFLGYILAVIGLLCDLGRPWVIWHAIIYWNPHSVMFEVAWCVMLYTTVLFLEFVPVIFERFQLTGALRIMHKITIPLVIVGVILSTLHQSSLGSLFVVIPGRMHPLWYSNIIPFIFFISCVAAGLSMIIFESHLSSRAFGREIEQNLLEELGNVLVVILALYFVVRVQDLMNRNALQYVFDGTYHSWLFLMEIIIGAVLPFCMLVWNQIRKSKQGLFYTSIMILLGFIAHRVNTTITSFEVYPTKTYIPSWQEFAVTTGLVSIGFIAFVFIARYFKVFPEKQKRTEKLVYEPANEHYTSYGR